VTLFVYVHFAVRMETELVLNRCDFDTSVLSLMTPFEMKICKLNEGINCVHSYIHEARLCTRFITTMKLEFGSAALNVYIYH